MLVRSNLQGRYRAAVEAADQGFKLGEKLIWKDFSFNPAADSIWYKTNFHKFNFELLDGYSKRKAWTIAWVDNTANLENAKQVIAKFVGEFGFIPNDPELLIKTDWGKALLEALKTEQHDFQAWHVETVFKTNAQTAYIDGKWAEYTEQAADGWIESLTYLALRNARPGHRALHKTTKTINDPFWKRFLPPIDYNCRCTVVANYLGSTRKVTTGIPKDPETGKTVQPGQGFGSKGYSIGDFKTERLIWLTQ